jgi:hypothetical protein
MKIRKSLILYILLALFCTGCYPVGNLYQIPPPNMPLPFNPGETKINTYLSSLGYGVQASCAIDSHFVIMVNANGQNTQYNRWYGENDDPTLSTTMSNFQGDIGGGYYKHLDTMVRFEILGGIGYANDDYYDVSPSINGEYNSTTVASGQFIHLLLQSDVGLVVKHVELAVGLRLSNLVAKTNYNFRYYDPGSSVQQNYFLNETGDALFLEPYLTFAWGFKNVKLITSVTLSGKIFGPDINLPFDTQFSGQYKGQYGGQYPGDGIAGSLYQNFNFSLGLLINFNRKDMKR